MDFLKIFNPPFWMSECQQKNKNGDNQQSFFIDIHAETNIH